MIINIKHFGKFYIRSRQCNLLARHFASSSVVSIKCNNFYSILTQVSFQPTTKLFINGKFVESKTNQWIDVHNPVIKLCSKKIFINKFY